MFSLKNSEMFVAKHFIETFFLRVPEPSNHSPQHSAYPRLSIYAVSTVAQRPVLNEGQGTLPGRAKQPHLRSVVRF